MKSLLSLLICSALAGTGGFFYGRMSAPHTATPKPEPVQIVQTLQAASPEVAEIEAPEAEAVPLVAPVEIAPKAEPTHAERAAQPMQTLIDTQGRQIQAEVLAVDSNTVKIRRDDGLETSFPLEMLRPEDIAFCEYLRAHPPQTEKTANKAQSADDIDWDAIFGS